MPPSPGDWVRSHPGLWRALQKARAQAYRTLPPFSYADVPGRFHRSDRMFRTYGSPSPETARRYLASGNATVSLIVDHLVRAGVEPQTARWLEIGAGFGRLIRVLVDHARPERVWAMELDPDALAFVAREFGVHPVGSTEAFEPSEPVAADAVYAISVITHVDRVGTDAFMALVARTLQPGGAVLFTSHGSASLAVLGNYDDGRYEPRRTEVEASLKSDGMAFVPYGWTDTCGMTWHDPDHLRSVVAAQAPDLVEVTFEPGGLDGHQDIWVYRRT